MAAFHNKVTKKKFTKNVNPLFEKRPRNFGIGQHIQYKRDLNRWVRWPKYVKLQRQSSILRQKLKIPPPIKTFSNIIDGNTVNELFKILQKYQPETKAAKMRRLQVRAEKKVEKNVDKLSKRPTSLRHGVNTVT